MLVCRLLKRQIVLKKATSSRANALEQGTLERWDTKQTTESCVWEGDQLLLISYHSQVLCHRQNASPDLHALCFSFYPGARPLPKGCYEAPVKCQDTQRDTSHKVNIKIALTYISACCKTVDEVSESLWLLRWNSRSCTSYQGLYLMHQAV